MGRETQEGEVAMNHAKKKGLIKSAFDLTLEKIETISNLMLIVLLIGLTLLLGTSIAMRYFLGQPIAWANAVARYTYIYIVMIGGGVSYRLEGQAVI